MRALSRSEGKSGGAWPGGPPPPPMDMLVTMRVGGFSIDGTSFPYAARADISPACGPQAASLVLRAPRCYLFAFTSNYSEQELRSLHAEQTTLCSGSQLRSHPRTRKLCEPQARTIFQASKNISCKIPVRMEL